MTGDYAACGHADARPTSPRCLGVCVSERARRRATVACPVACRPRNTPDGEREASDTQSRERARRQVPGLGRLPLLQNLCISLRGESGVERDGSSPLTGGRQVYTSFWGSLLRPCFGSSVARAAMDGRGAFRPTCWLFTSVRIPTRRTTLACPHAALWWRFTSSSSFN